MFPSILAKLLIFTSTADFKPVKYKSDAEPRNSREMPPYNGFGSEEDSLCSCMGLLPKPPKRDFIKFMEKDRHGLDSNVIRFHARMDTTKPIDMDRRFIISYFLSDDTILVFEPPVRNSGILFWIFKSCSILGIQNFAGGRGGGQGDHVLSESFRRIGGFLSFSHVQNHRSGLSEHGQWGPREI